MLCPLDKKNRIGRGFSSAKMSCKNNLKKFEKVVDKPKRICYYKRAFRNEQRKRPADVAELAYAHDSGSCEHYARAGSSPAIRTKDL